MGSINARASLALSLAIALASSALAQSHASPSGVRPCEAKDLSLGTDDENGAFDGMSHSGTLLVVRNLSPGACSLAPVPRISFTGPDGKDAGLQVTPDTPFNRGPVVNGHRLPMGHGPVVLPITLASGAEATASLRWVSGNVYDHGTCITPVSMQVTVGASPLTAGFQRSVCGDARTHIVVTTTLFAVDPVYKPQ